jgi:alkanesulfonate monooxygenase SsuD/methylene tetrahydromethanopterin reductase-like flavin-dependent oxidoreductase (luciferase family)
VKFGILFGTGGPVKPPGSDDWPADRERRYFAELLDQAELADRLGFDYLWATEHHFTPDFSHFADPMLVLAAASQRTRTIRLGTGIMQLSHRHPVLAAESIAMLDQLSGGRAEFGVGTGYPAERLPFTGEEDGTARRREAVPQVARMLASRGRYPGFSGTHFGIPPLNIVPKAVQRPHPPLWLACSRPETITEAAGTGMGALVLSFAGVEQLAGQVSHYWETIRSGCVPAGLAINPAVATFTIALVASTDEEAHARADEGVGYSAFGGLAHDGTYANAAEVNVYRDYLAARDGPADSPASQLLAAFAASPSHLVGSVETVLGKLRAVEATGVDMIVLALRAGQITHEHALETIEGFGRHILPEFRKRHPEHLVWRTAQLGTTGARVSSSI